MFAIGIPGGAGLLNAVILIAAMSAMNSQLYTASRMLFSLARARQAPSLLGRVNAAGVPLMALAASTLGIAPATLLYLYQPQRAFGIMIGISAFGAMSAWMMIFLSHLVFRARSREHAFRMWGYPWTSIAGAAAMAAILLSTPFIGPFKSTLLYGTPFLLLLSLC